MQKHKVGKKAVGLLLLLCIISTLTVQVQGSLSGLVVEDESGVKSTESNYALKQENSYLQLYVGEDTGTIRVVDKRNQAVWENTTSVTNEEIANSYIRDNLYAPVMLSYTNLDSAQMSVIETHSTENATVKVTGSGNSGAVATFTFEKLGITFSLQYTLDGDSLLVKLPADSINETTANKIVSVKVLPYFGAARTTDTGYVLYPDGSGAISSFSSKLTTYYKNFSADVYGEDMEYLLKGDDEKATQDTCLPIFGMVKNKQAFFACIEEGEADSRIYYDPSGYHFYLYRTYSEFVFRRSYTATLTSGRTKTVIESDGVYYDRQLRYTFFANEDVSYSNMAACYQQLLVKNGKLNVSSLTSESTPFLLELFNGVVEDQVLMDKYIRMTTFSDAKNILSELSEAGADNLLVSLMGWTKEGYNVYPASSDVADDLGGTSGLKSLMESAGSKNMKVVLRSNYLYGDKDTAKISMNDVIYAPGGLRPYTNMGNGSNRYLFSLPYIQSRFKADLSAFSKLGFGGFAFEALGNTVYYDYKENHGITHKSDMIAYWQTMMQQTKDAGGVAMVQGGNQYVLSQADWIFNLSESDSGYLFATETVPFYQMVVHGYIPYSGTAVNLFYDENEQLLKQIEYGYTPVYRLTAESPDLMIESRYNELFSSQYEEYKESLLTLYAKWQNDFARLGDKKLVDHAQVADNVYKSLYEDGTAVYVNYSDKEAVVEGVTVGANNYAVYGG